MDFLPRACVGLTLFIGAAVVPLHAQSPLEGQTLDLSSVIRRTLESNLDLQIRDQTPLIAQDAIARAKAQFDPSVFLEVGYDESERQQNAIEFVGTGGIVPQQGRFEEENLRGKVGIGGKLFTGAEYELSANISEMVNSINRDSPSALFSPEYQTFTGLSLTQPLLQGFGSTAALAEIRIAQRELNVSEFERELEVTNKVIEVTNAYYDLVFGQENLRVKQDADGLARQLLDESSRRFDVGRMSALDVAQAEVKVSEAEESVLLARDFLRERQVALIKLISPSFDAMTLPDFRVSTQFSTNYSVGVVQSLIAQAEAGRPDFLLAQEELATAGLRHGRSRNGSLPALDLQFSYGLNGLSDSAGRSMDRIWDANEPSWRAGFRFNVPLGNRSARAESRAAQRSETQAKLRLQQVEMNLRLDIHNAVSRLGLQTQRLKTAATSRRVAEEALTAENKRLEAGQTTSFNVLLFQDKVSSARTREVAAQVDLEKTLAEVWAASGQLFEKTGFTFARRADESTVDGFSLMRTFSRE